MKRVERKIAKGMDWELFRSRRPSLLFSDRKAPFDNFDCLSVELLSTEQFKCRSLNTETYLIISIDVWVRWYWLKIKNKKLLLYTFKWLEAMNSVISVMN